MTRVTVIPALRYRDAGAAIGWLCEAFGFTEHAVYRGDEGEVRHAQLTFGNGMIMLGSARDDEHSATQASPDEIDGRNTQSPYIVVGDVASHHARATAAGAEIVMPLADQGHGMVYTCRDPEGHLWTFGDYDPWAEPPAE